MTTLLYFNSLSAARDYADLYENLGYAVELNVNRGSGPLFILAVTK